MRGRPALDRWDNALLGLAGLGIALHGATLVGQGPGPWGSALAHAVDAIFCADLLARLWWLGRAYRTGPWIAVDVVSAAPALAELLGLPGLELLRLARVLRALRALRVLRGLRGVRMLDWAARPVDAEDRGAAGLIAASVAAAATALVAAVAALRSLAPSEAAADLAEAGVLAGAVLGLVLVVAVARIQAAGAAGRQLRALLDVALPHQAAAAFLADPETSARVERAPGTVIFCDLRGFSAAVERHGLDRLRGRLEAALGAVVDAHVAEDLLVDKLLGDAVMSFRAGSLVRGDAGEHARRCVRAALASQRAVAALRDPDFAGVKVGGASAPDLWVGAFTGGRRLAFTALHDRVNVAARLEAACGALGTETLFDRATVDVAGPMDGVVWRRAGRIAVHGKVEVLEVWEALPSEVDGPWRALFGDALQAFENGDRDPTAFVAVDRARPGGDALARVYADRCATQGSDPVLRLVK